MERSSLVRYRESMNKLSLLRGVRLSATYPSEFSSSLRSDRLILAEVFLDFFLFDSNGSSFLSFWDWNSSSSISDLISTISSVFTSFCDWDASNLTSDFISAFETAVEDTSGDTQILFLTVTSGSFDLHSLVTAR